MSADWLEAGTRYSSAERQKVRVSRDREGKINNQNILTIDLPPTSLKDKIEDEQGKNVVMAKVHLEGSSKYTYSHGLGEYHLIGLEGNGKERKVKVNANG